MAEAAALELENLRNRKLWNKLRADVCEELPASLHEYLEFPDEERGKAPTWQQTALIIIEGYAPIGFTVYAKTVCPEEFDTGRWGIGNGTSGKYKIAAARIAPDGHSRWEVAYFEADTIEEALALSDEQGAIFMELAKNSLTERGEAICQ